jgi:5-methylcytosine-specific restriction enzyme B
MSNYSWLPVFKEMSDWLVGYEGRQEELVQVLRDIGVDKGLEDELSDGSKEPLHVIDPFTFFATFMKYGEGKRKTLFENYIKLVGLPVDPPQDFSGVPSTQPLKVWLFPYARERKDSVVPSLWKLFHQVRSGAVDGNLFNEVLAIPNTGFAKLTECMFYIAPENHFPVDAQTKPWLQAKNYDIPAANWSGYSKLISWLQKNADRPFYQISYEAYLQNRGADEGVKQTSGAYMDGKHMDDSTKLVTEHQIPFWLNQILYGPPGTGKTYRTTELAVQIADPEGYKILAAGLSPAERRQAVKAKYDELVSRARIDFATFHQSFSYEDFVEGIRAETSDDGTGLEYKVVDGVFKNIATAADETSEEVEKLENLGISESPKIWKISIGPAWLNEKRERYIGAGEARIGWNHAGNLSRPLEQRSQEERDYWNNKMSSFNRSAVNGFVSDVQVGDILLCFKSKSSIQAVGVVTSEYRFDPQAALAEDNGDAHSYAHVRQVNWILKGIDLNIRRVNNGKQLVQQTLYPLRDMSWEALQAEIKNQGYSLPGAVTAPSTVSNPNYVIIIDEINRGNTARIFGELITLLEPDKRKGGSDERTVILPYSKKSFTVPSNLYVIGTMNTADKSLAQLDLALRRRFEFVEVMPEPSLLQDVTVHGVSMQDLLQTINDRIEVLLDRDHLIGHSYFLPLKSEMDESTRIDLLADIFEKRVIPLLQEYFFADWEKIGWVLNDIGKPKEFRFVQMAESNEMLKQLFSAEIADQLQDRRYTISNKEAFKAPEAYRGIFPGNHK